MQRGFSGVLLLFVILLLAVGGSGGFYLYNQQKLKLINSFEECAKHFPVMESYPEQCNTSDGKHFVRELSEEEKRKLAPPLDPSTSSVILPSKIFKDQDLGIEFSYPNDWLFEDKNNGLYRYIVFGKPLEVNHIGQKVPPYPANFVTLSLYPIKPGQSTNQARNLGQDMIIKWEEIKVAGLNVQKVTHKGCVSADCIEIIFANQSMLFAFSTENLSKPEYLNYLNKLVETFKFIR